MIKNRVPVLIPQSPSREIDDKRVTLAFVENDEGFYLIGGGRQPDLNYMGDYLRKQKVPDDRIKIYEGIGNYAEFFYRSLGDITDADKFQIATNKVGLRRFELYRAKAIEEGLLDSKSRIKGIRTDEPLKTLIVEYLGRISDWGAFRKRRFTEGLRRKCSLKVFGYDVRKIGI